MRFVGLCGVVVGTVAEKERSPAPAGATGSQFCCLWFADIFVPDLWIFFNVVG